MRILEVNTEKTWRGGERQTFFALKGLKLHGVDVELLAIKGFPLQEKSEKEGFKTHCVKGHWGVIPFLILKGGKYDIIHVQTASLLTFAILTKPFHKSKVVYTRRLDFVPKGSLTKWKYNQADLIIAISTPIKTILEKFGVRKLCVIPECIEEKNLDAGRGPSLLRENKWENKKIIGTTAALVQHKDPQTLVKTIEALSKLRNDFVLIHFGEGPLRPEIEQMIEERKLQEYYHLMGFRQNVEDFFSIFDVFVMSSEEEGLGSSVLDAFIYKVPVVSTKAGGLAEIVLNRGILVDVKDYNALAKALDQTLNDPSVAYTEDAHSYAKTELTVKKIHAMYMEVFQELLKE